MLSEIHIVSPDYNESFTVCIEDACFEEPYNFSFCVYKYNTVCAAQLAGTYKMEKGLSN